MVDYVKIGMWGTLGLEKALGTYIKVNITMIIILNHSTFCDIPLLNGLLAIHIEKGEICVNESKHYFTTRCKQWREEHWHCEEKWRIWFSSTCMGKGL